MRLFLAAVVSLGVVGSSFAAAPKVAEAPIIAYGTPTTVSISTSAWTVVPAASSLTSRTGIIVSVPSTLNANVVGHLGSCASTSVATTVRPDALS